MTLFFLTAPPTSSPAAPPTMELLEQVNNYYNTAWGHLLAYTAVLIGVAGVAIPLLSYFLQSRSLKGEKEALMRKLRDEVNAMTAKFQQDIANRFEQTEKQIREGRMADLQAKNDSLLQDINQRHAALDQRTKVAIAEVEGGVYHVQAQTVKDHPPAAVVSACTAIESYLEAGAEGQIRAAINIVEAGLSECTLEDAEHYKKPVEALLTSLRDNNIRGSYDAPIRTIKANLTTALARVTVPRNPGT